METKPNCIHIGTPGWQLAFPPRPDEPVLDKTKNNAFAGTQLGELVDRNAAIVVVGMQSDFCVRATCSYALGRGNSVFLVEVSLLSLATGRWSS